MRAVAQRVSRAEVRVNDQVVASIGPGLLAYVGSADGDGPGDVDYIAEKLATLRIFQDSAGKMNLSVRDVGGQVLVVPAFTTLADARQGRRPAFIQAARPEVAEPAFGALLQALAARGIAAAAGRFREIMAVESINDGPICILLDSRRQF